MGGGAVSVLHMINTVAQIDSNEVRTRERFRGRRLSNCFATIVLLASTLWTLGNSFEQTSAAGAIPDAPGCAATSVRVTEYNTLVGAGHVNDLFWIRNVSDRACSISGYPKVDYVNSKGRPLSVGTSDSPGQDGNFVGGLKRGRVLPTSTLAANGGLASFWVDGLDIQVGTPQPACIDSTRMFVVLPRTSTPMQVQTIRGNGYFWCGGIVVLPVLPGNSGSDPSMPLRYYFGV